VLRPCFFSPASLAGKFALYFSSEWMYNTLPQWERRKTTSTNRSLGFFVFAAEHEGRPVANKAKPRTKAAGGAVAVVIPARYASTRLPGKPLLEVNGKYLIQFVYEKACAARLASQVIIATDDKRIFDAAKAFGARVEMTNARHQSGTDRIAELVRSGRVRARIIVNVQGDEPEIDPASIDAAARLLLDDASADIATLVTPVASFSEYENPNAVKAVVGSDGFALYFSRAQVPFVRDGVSAKTDFAALGIYRHLGLYAYRRDALLAFAAAPQSRLEKLEKLEQLRALEMGLRIKTAVTRSAPAGIDTEADFRAFVRRQNLSQRRRPRSRRQGRGK
jgi:3-deoxy-manno-octulosonate cytidylyltransferase (CMP-KDO synthetase)